MKLKGKKQKFQYLGGHHQEGAAEGEREEDNIDIFEKMALKAKMLHIRLHWKLHKSWMK